MRKGLSKKLQLSATGVLLLSVLAGCGNNGNNENNGASAAPASTGASESSAASGEKVTITMEVGQALKENYAHVFTQANLDEFEKQTNIKVDVIIDPDNQVKNVLQTKLATGEPPDIMVYNKVSGENELNTANTTLDLSGEPWVQRLVNPEGLKAPDGKIHGFVMQSPLDAQLIVYNKAIFNELNLQPPTSFDEFLEVNEAIKNAGIAPIFAPFKDRWTFQIWAAGTFGYVATHDRPNLWEEINAGTTKFADIPEFEEILAKAMVLVDKGYIGKSALSDDYNMAPDVFSKKKAAMMIMGDWFISDMATKDPSLELGFFPIPAFNGKELMISQSQIGAMMHIPNKAKHPNEAKKFLDFLSQKEQMARAQEGHPFMPSVNDAAPPELTPLQQDIYDNYIKTNRTVVEMNAFMKVDLTELWKFYQDMIAGGKTPKQVLEAWDKKFAELMNAANQPGF